jgi:hypothetical protein
MDQLRQLVSTHQNKFQFLLLGGVGLAAFNTLARPDFNLILYLYIFYIWKFMENSKEAQASEKINTFYILLYSLLIDFIWTIFWGAKWNMLKVDYEGTIHGMVIFFSWIAIILKVNYSYININIINIRLLSYYSLEF